MAVPTFLAICPQCGEEFYGHILPPETHDREACIRYLSERIERLDAESPHLVRDMALREN